MNTPEQIPRWDLLPLPDLQLCVRIGDRISTIARDLVREHRAMIDHAHIIDRGDAMKGEPRYEAPHPLIVAQDIATVHLSQPLDLQAFYEAPTDWLLSDYAAIKKFIDRATFAFPIGVPLRYRKSSGFIVNI